MMRCPPGNTNIQESVSDLDSAESKDIYHNLDLWENGSSNLMWVTGLSGSGKSTIAKEIANTDGAQHIELDDLQRAKLRNWDSTGFKILDDYIASKGGLTNIFSYVNDIEKPTFRELVLSNEEGCANQFKDVLNYIISYAKKHKDEKFVVEGVQIAFYASDDIIAKISEYPVVIKMTGPLKAEFRRDIRLINSKKESGDSFVDIFKKISHRISNWFKEGFYKSDFDKINSFKSAIGESFIPLKREGKEWEHSNGEYTFENENIHMRPATEDDIDNMYQWEMESIDKSLIDNEKVQSLIRQDCHDSLKDTLMIMDGDNTIGMFTACMIDDGEWRYIGEIYLIPEYRGQGIGSTILRNEMANYDKIRLQVAMDNEGAFKLYTSLGFKIAKEDETNKMYILEYIKPESIQEAVTIDGYRLIELAYMDKFPNMSPEQEAVLKDYSNARDQLVAAASYYKREKNARKKALKRIQLQHNTSDSEYFKNQCNQKMAVIRQEIEVLDKEYAEAYQRNVATMNQLADEFDKLETQKQQAGGNNTTAPKPSNSGYPDSITIPLPRIPRPSELLGKFLNAQEDTQL